MAEVMAALNDPAKSRVDEMLAAAERAEREYAAAAAAYVQTPADIVAQARAVQDQAAENSFSIYQLKGGNCRRFILCSLFGAALSGISKSTTCVLPGYNARSVSMARLPYPFARQDGSMARKKR